MSQLKNFYETLYSDDEYEGGRHDFKYQIIQKALHKIKPSGFENHLDIGASKGCFLKQMNARRQHGVEIADRARAILEQKGIATFAENDVEQMSLPSGKFDLISSLDVLEHLFEPYLVVKKLYEATAPGGLIVITLPNDVLNLKQVLKILFKKEDSIFKYTDNGHIRFFCLESAANMVSRAGFKVIERFGYGRRTILNRFIPNLTSYGYVVIGQKS